MTYGKCHMSQENIAPYTPSKIMRYSPSHMAIYINLCDICIYMEQLHENERVKCQRETVTLL